MNWKAKLIKLIDTELLLKNVLDHFKMLIETLSTTSSGQVQEIISLNFGNRLYGHYALLIVNSRDFVDAVIEYNSLHSLRLS